MSARTARRRVIPQRRWDIGWLRVLATLLPFYFHPAKIFYLWDLFYIKNGRLSSLLSYTALFIQHWHMPLFFIVAGAATWFALRRRSGGQYDTERLKRLLAPFIFGLFVIVPPQIYFALRHQRSDYTESYLQFYPHFFDPAYTGGKFDMGHLWFIIYLFLFSLIYLVYGYILIANARFEEVIDKHKAAALILGVLILVVWLALVSSEVFHPDWLRPIRETLIAWLCLIMLLGYGRTYLNLTNRFLSYFSETGYPLDILHQTVIIIIGFYVVQWNAGVLVKFVAIVVASFVITTAPYNVLVKRTNITRILFGMRLR